MASTEDASKASSSSAPPPTSPYYKYMFKPDKTPTPQLNALLRAIGQYIIDNIGDTSVSQLTPKKLAAFYREVHGNYDALFLESTDQSISCIWQVTGCEHSLQPSGDDFKPPTVPALTLKGFARWESIEILLGPEEHAQFLQFAVTNWALKHPDTGELFPTDLPRDVLPPDTDSEIERWFKLCGKTLLYETPASSHSTTSKEASPRATPHSEFSPRSTPSLHRNHEYWQPKYAPKAAPDDGYFNSRYDAHVRSRYYDRRQSASDHLPSPRDMPPRSPDPYLSSSDDLSPSHPVRRVRRPTGPPLRRLSRQSPPRSPHIRVDMRNGRHSTPDALDSIRFKIKKMASALGGAPSSGTSIPGNGSSQSIPRYSSRYDSDSSSSDGDEKFSERRQMRDRRRETRVRRERDRQGRDHSRSRERERDRERERERERRNREREKDGDKTDDEKDGDDRPSPTHLQMPSFSHRRSSNGDINPRRSGWQPRSYSGGDDRHKRSMSFLSQ